MTVKGQDIHAYSAQRQQRFVARPRPADGHVEVHQTASGSHARRTSEHAEYYVDEDKVILEGGQPRFVDSTRGTTRGQKLTWYSSDDRLMVNGVPQHQVKSVLHRKTKPNQ